MTWGYDKCYTACKNASIARNYTRKIVESPGFPTIYNSLSINVIFFVKKKSETLFYGQPLYLKTKYIFLVEMD